MENASKALLISASVLIVIVLIAVGIRILNSTSGVSNEVGKVSDAMGLSVFNSQFTDYQGKQKGSEVKALLSKVIANNRGSNTRKVSVTSGTSTGVTDANTISNIISGLNLKTNYTVGITYDTTGYVNGITITEPTA